MRAAKIAFTAITVIGIAACVHEERKVVPPSPSEAHAPPSTYSPPQYLVADPAPRHGGTVVLPLGGPGVRGLVVDKRRLVVGPGEPRVALDVTSEPIVGASKIPARFGSGFLFWTANTLYRSSSFESALTPIVHVPDAIESISLAPKAVVVRTHNGERWGLRLPSGERASVEPLGAADVQALDDGRALAFDDRGSAFTSLDHGAHWTDVTAQMKSAPAKVAVVGDELWLYESNVGASRLEPDGRLAWFDRPPPDPSFELRMKDPRWRGSEAPLRMAFRAGAALDEATAIVIDGGDVVRVAVQTGEVLSVVPGRLPPDAQCEAVPTPGDVVFACTSRGGGGSAFVVSRTIGSESPLLEQTLAAGGQFFASDDGGLAYGGACQGAHASTSAAPTVCVRMPGGRWEERDLSGLSSDGGGADFNVARWVPRADGHVVAIVVDPSTGIYDPSSGSFLPIDEESREVVGRGIAVSAKFKPTKSYKRGGFTPTGVVDPSWSFGSGNSLRGWQRHGESLEISEEGKLTRSPFSFDVVFAGAMGLGRAKDGRLYQSNDHGVTWVEVATPPSGVEALELVSCTSAGCDLGAFYRVGWLPRAPHADPPKTTAAPAPEIRHVRGLELSCRPAGSVSSKVLPRTSDSPEDLGLGMNRLPVASEKTDYSYVRNAVPRGIVSPIHDAAGSNEDLPALRGLFSGFGTSRDGGTLTVSGPNKNAMQLRRGVSYVSPFDPSGRVVRSGIAISDVVAAGRRAGMTNDDILAEDFTETGTVIAIGSSDPFAVSDIAVQNADHGLLSILRGDRVRVAIRPSQNNANIISGAWLPGEDAAFLEVDSSGIGHVFKVGSGGVSDLFDVSPNANETSYPANPDALAVGPKGDLAILRTPSGSDPPSALDPAFLIVPATPPSALAPWSELRLADDAACKSEAGGHRAVIQAIAPWIRVTTPELRVETAPMIARVRWTPKRVCLEGFEVKLPNVTMHVPGPSGNDVATFGTWLVGKGSTYARVGVSEGIEWRQALECAIVTTGP